MKKEKSAGSVVFKDNGERKFLLLHYRRINDKKGEHNYWDFPKGHIEEGETEVHTALREIEEETGIKDVKIIEGFRKVIKYFFSVNGNLIQKDVVFLLCKTKTEDVKISKEHIGYKWFDYEEAMKTLEFRNSKEVLKEAEEFIKKRKNLLDW